MKSTLRIERKDGSYRVIECVGNYTMDMAIKLARDLEGDLYKNVIISK